MVYENRQRSGCGGIRLVIALLFAAFSVFSYYRMSQPNPITGKNQHIDITPQQEIALGLRAEPEMAAQYGGEDPDPKAQRLVEQIGEEVVSHSDAGTTQYKFQFHALQAPQTINAFALPGGQVFVTRGLLKRLTTKGELAGVLAHEVGHVVARHSAQQMAKQRLTQGLTGAAVVASTDPTNPHTYRNAAIAQIVGQLVSLKFSRNDELEADKLGVRFMTEAGYDPHSMIDVMRALEQAAGRGGIEFFETHPNPENRIVKIQQDIQSQFPNGLPPGLRK